MAKSRHAAWPIGAGATGSTPVGQRTKHPEILSLAGARHRRWVGLQREARRANAYLVPLRWFIGIGWLRASVEKLVDPAWHDGDALRAFIEEVTSGAMAFPEFGALLGGLIEPAAPLVSWLVISLQLYCGAGILLGRATNAALLTGIGLNLTFMLAGIPNPSAFYILIQVVLFAADAGATAGFDGAASAPPRSLLIAARAGHRDPNQSDRWWLAGLGGAFGVISTFAFAHGTDFSPAGSVNDPALVLGTVTALGGLMLLIGSLRSTTSFELDLSEPRFALEAARR